MGCEIGAGGSGTFGRMGRRTGATVSGASAEVFVFVARREASRLSDGVSTCCTVELKYRARFGRRKVGGNADVGILESNMDRRIDLLSILRLWGVDACAQCPTLKEYRDVVLDQSLMEIWYDGAKASIGLALH